MESRNRKLDSSKEEKQILLNLRNISHYYCWKVGNIVTKAPSGAIHTLY